VKTLRALGDQLRRHLPLVISEVLLLFTLLLFDRPLIRGDAVAYFMWMASLGKDLDLDLQNQAERFGPLNTYMALFNPETGRYANAFAWGQGLILLPSFWAARLLDRLPVMRINDDWFLSLQAYPFAYSLTAMLQVNLMTLLTLAMAYALGRRLNLSAGAAAMAGLTVTWGTPLYYYSTVHPVYSHASATFVHTLGVLLFVRSLTAPAGQAHRWRWLATGLACGLAALTRWQLALSFVVLGGVLVFRRRWRELIWMGLGFGAVTWHIPYTFNWMFGSPLAIPVDALQSPAEGEQSFVGLPRYLWPVLFAEDRGLFIWSPIAALGMAGLLCLEQPRRDLALALLGIVVAQVLVNSGVRDWYGGDSFGLRRLTEIYPALAVGVGALLTAAERKGNRGLASAAYGVVVLLAVYGLVLVPASLVFDYFTTDPSFGYFTTPPSSSVANVWLFFFWPPKFDLIWPMMEHHFGPWAWTWPGP